MEEKYPTAFFVSNPRTSAELKILHAVSRESPYTIEKTIFLRPIDYENFITDMLPERVYIEKNRAVCGIRNGIYCCILIKIKEQSEGILVCFPFGGSFYAAFYEDF